jgi:hypothetical protein
MRRFRIGMRVTAARSVPVTPENGQIGDRGFTACRCVRDADDVSSAE